MLAPVDSKAVVKVGDEEIVLRLNFASIARAADAGINLLSETPPELDEIQGIRLVKCLAAQEQPHFTEDHILALLASSREGVATALIELFSKFGGKAEEGSSGNAKANQEASP